MTSSFDIAAAKRNLSDATEKKQRTLDTLYQHACTDCAAIIRMIIDTYNPRRIYQWGSLLDRRFFSDSSDIDIAVEGLPDAATYFKLLGEAMVLTDFPLDIVELDKIEPEFADDIVTRGRLVHERT